MPNDAFIPARGDVVWLTLTPQAGHEQTGRRPALTLSPRSYNERVGLAIFCPITNRAKGYPFEVEIPQESQVSGVILADQVKNLDWRARGADLIAPLPDAVVQDVLAKLNTLLRP